MNNTISAHYQTWKNKKNVELVLSTFREHYKDSPIRMVSDAGDDFSDLAEKYNCIFDYEEENIYPKAIFAGHSIWENPPSFYGSKIWLKRLYDTCVYFDTDWVILLEDDVFTVNKIKNFPSYDAAGSVRIIEFKQPLINYLMSRNTKNKLWGFNLSGGCIINRKFYIEAYENHINDFDVKFMSNLDDRIGGWSDVLLNAFIIFSGGNVGKWDGTISPPSNWKELKLENGSYKIKSSFIHGDKSMYEDIQGSLYKIK